MGASDIRSSYSEGLLKRRTQFIYWHMVPHRVICLMKLLSFFYEVQILTTYLPGRLKIFRFNVKPNTEAVPYNEYC